MSRHIGLISEGERGKFCNIPLSGVTTREKKYHLLIEDNELTHNSYCGTVLDKRERFYMDWEFFSLLYKNDVLCKRCLNTKTGKKYKKWLTYKQI